MNPISIATKINRSIQYEGKDFLYFSGTAYLGMGSLPEFESLVIAGFQKYGPNYGASRFSTVQLKVYEEMETFFALQAEAEKAIVMSSGFLAGYVCATVLKKISDKIWVAPDTHPAILPEGIIPAEFEDFKQFRQKCVELSRIVEGETISIFCNAVDPLKPLIYNFDWVKELSDKNTYNLLLDDSHAFGLIGKGLFGTYSQFKNLPINLIISGSMNKALGIPAGIILGKNEFIKNINSHPIFIAASPPAPGYCQAFLSGQNLYEEQRKRLQINCSYFFPRIHGSKDLSFQNNFPVATFKNPGWVQRLKEKQILISSFPYPKPDDKPMERIIISAYHSQEDLDYLAEWVNYFLTHKN